MYDKKITSRKLVSGALCQRRKRASRGGHLRGEAEVRHRPRCCLTPSHNKLLSRYTNSPQPRRAGVYFLGTGGVIPSRCLAIASCAQIIISFLCLGHICQLCMACQQSVKFRSSVAICAWVASCKLFCFSEYPVVSR